MCICCHSKQKIVWLHQICPLLVKGISTRGFNNNIISWPWWAHNSSYKGLKLIVWLPIHRSDTFWKHFVQTKVFPWEVLIGADVFLFNKELLVLTWPREIHKPNLKRRTSSSSWAAWYTLYKYITWYFLHYTNFFNIF